MWYSAVRRDRSRDGSWGSGQAATGRPSRASTGSPTSAGPRRDCHPDRASARAPVDVAGPPDGFSPTATGHRAHPSGPAATSDCIALDSPAALRRGCNVAVRACHRSARPEWLTISPVWTRSGEAMGTLGDIEQAEVTGPPEPFRPERLAGVVNAVSDPITVQAVDGRVVFANLAAARAVGAESPDQLAAAAGDVLDRFELFDELGRPVDQDELPGRTALRTGVAQALTIRSRDRATGAERWSAISAVPLFDDEGHPEFAVNIIHDVTKSKSVEEALRVSEARSRLLADATRDLDESLDLDRTIATSMALAVPHLADWATLDLVQPDGSVERVAG